MKTVQKRLLLGLPVLLAGIGLLAAARTEILPDSWMQSPSTLPVYFGIWVASGAAISLGITSLSCALDAEHFWFAVLIGAIIGLIAGGGVFWYALCSGHGLGWGV